MEENLKLPRQRYTFNIYLKGTEKIVNIETQMKKFMSFIKKCDYNNHIDFVINGTKIFQDNMKKAIQCLDDNKNNESNLLAIIEQLSNWESEFDKDFIIYKQEYINLIHRYINILKHMINIAESHSINNFFIIGCNTIILNLCEQIDKIKVDNYDDLRSISEYNPIIIGLIERLGTADPSIAFDLEDLLDD